MDQKISAIINTFNEEGNIAEAIKSVEFADEIIVCDMHSQDKTSEIAKKNGAKVFLHKYTGFVEPARNFAISKASFDWILILDADERIPTDLAKRIKEIVRKTKSHDFVQIPRKNIIFGKWMQASGWWPDYQIRLFKKGRIVWSDKIHSQPETKGEGLTLPAEERYSILHNNYQTVNQFIERMNRYTTIEAEELIKKGYKFSWRDLIEKPFSEFLGRFFANRGFDDGLHGLVLSLLQSFSFVIVYLKTWEKSKFRQENINISDIMLEAERSGKSISYWFGEIAKSKSPFSNFFKIFKRQ